MDKNYQSINIIKNIVVISEENATSTEKTSASVEVKTASITQISQACEKLSKLAKDMFVSITIFKI